MLALLQRVRYEEHMSGGKREKLQSVKGMHDILPADMPRWRQFENAFRRIAAVYGYEEIRTPLLEPTDLFVHSIGETTDIVEKEMYTFVDQGEKSLTLRPEGTASCVRAYIEHNISNQEPVSKWFYLGPMYRRERPAKGRYRQFYQAGVEVFGDAGPVIDAEVIALCVQLLSELGVSNVEVLVNSLGSRDGRQSYRDALRAYLEPFRAQLCGDCQRRIDANPLRVLDCKVPNDAKIAQGAPTVLELLGADDRSHFDRVCALLDQLKIRYRVEPRLVRGLDYYTRTLFEVRDLSGELGAQSALLGGGRYDHMVQDLDGPAQPAIGFAMGIERILSAMPASAEPKRSGVFVVCVQPDLAKDALELAQALRKQNIAAGVDLRGSALKKQLARADKNRAQYVVILGPDEIAKGVVQLKNLETQNQEEVPRQKLIEKLQSVK